MIYNPWVPDEEKEQLKRELAKAKEELAKVKEELENSRKDNAALLKVVKRYNTDNLRKTKPWGRG